MKQLKLFRNLSLFLILSSCIFGYVNAQEQNLYSISMKQSFTSWGNCRSDPDYERAYVVLFQGNPYNWYKQILSNELDQVIHVNQDFFIHSFDKNIENIVDSLGHDLDIINVYTFASDIINDVFLDYTFSVPGLIYGENKQEHSASDPCNNFISNNREGYTMITSIYVDDPVNLSLLGNATLSADYEAVSFNISDYYQYNNLNTAVLEVAPDGTDDWEPVKGVTLKPSSTLYLRYEQIAGDKADPNSNFFKWLGKNLQFRVVKTLMNGKKTFGQFVSGIKFYPEGLQYSILQSRRSTCIDDVFVYVKIKNATDRGYLTIDPKDFYWSATPNGGEGYACLMKEVADSVNVFKIALQHNMSIDPFINNTEIPMTWTLQLIEKTPLGNGRIACTKEFTIPAKPDSVYIEQMDSLFLINGVYYDVPAMNDLYALLSINDPYEFDYLRKPYSIKEIGSNDSLIVNDLPTPYDNMAQAQKVSMDSLFEREFYQMIDQSSNPYKSYYKNRLKTWCEQYSAAGDPLLLEQGVNPRLMPDGQSYLYLSDYVTTYGYNIYQGFINGNDSIQLTTNSPVTGYDVYLIINKTGTYYYYVHVFKENESDFSFKYNIWRAPITGGNGVCISEDFDYIPSIQLSMDNSTLYFIGEKDYDGALYKIPATNNSINVATRLCNAAGSRSLKISHNGTFLVFFDEDWQLGKFDLTTNTLVKIVGYGVDNFTISPNDQFLLYTHSESRNGWVFKTPIGNSINDGIEITNDVATSSSDPYIFKDNLSYLFPDGHYGSVELGEAYTKPEAERYLIRKAIAGNSIDNGTILHPGLRSHRQLSVCGNEGFCVYWDGFYKGYLHLYVFDAGKAAEALGEAFYPDISFAEEWCNDYKAIYKEKWLAKKLGIKYDINIKPNTTQHLVLTDGDNCQYPFDIYVKSPPEAYFTQAILSYPSDACAKDGQVRITYNGGGLPPYNHTNGTLSTGGNSIIVTDMGYGDNPVYLSYADGLESLILTAKVGSATLGITSVDTTPQTCETANGTIRINVGDVTGTKTYKITCDFPYKEYTATSVSNSYTFSNLPAGNYTVNVTSGSCDFTKTTIKVESKIFTIIETGKTNASTIGGTGSISLSFANRDNNVYWISGVPAVFNASENSDNINYTGVVPKTYNYIARHTDDYGKNCNVSGSFTIDCPQFEANINFDENDDSCIVSVSLTNGNSLITPYNIRLHNSSGTLLQEGGTGNNLLAIVKNPGNYTLNLAYGSNDVDIYSFSYPMTPISQTNSITAPICPGDDGSISITPSGGIDGSGFMYSLDGSTYTTTNTYTVMGGVFSFYIKDENTTYPDVLGNSLTVNKTKINHFDVLIPEPEPVDAGRVISNDVTCSGLNNGSVFIENLTGGSGQYQFNVDHGAWYDTTSTITRLTPGEHTVYLRDSHNNCPSVDIGHIDIKEPALLNIDTFIVTQPTCELENGEISSQISGGNGYYTFEWLYNGAHYYTSDSLIQDTVSYLGDTLHYGLYTLNVSDNKNCTAQQSLELLEYFNPQIDSSTVTDVRCYAESNGSVQINNVTGTNSVNSLVIEALDFVYADTIFDLGSSFNNLLKGRYNVTVYDSLECQIDIPYPVVVHQPDTTIEFIIDTAYSVINKGSATGAIKFMTFGGNTGLKNLQLINSEGMFIDSIYGINLFPILFDSLYAGEYLINATDIKGCHSTSDTVLVIEPDSTLGFIVTEKRDARCKSQTGGFTVEAYGGWGRYSYKKATDNGYYKFNTFDNLYAGNYVVSVRDKLGAVYSESISIYEPKDSLEAIISESHSPTCNNNGNITVDVNGGTMPYKLFFDNESDTSLLSSSQSISFIDKSAGEYLIHINDSNGCKFELEAILSGTNILQITDFILTYPSTPGGIDGSVEAIVKGGEKPLSFIWKEISGSEMAETSPIISNIPSGYYVVNVLEAGGCIDTNWVYLPDISDISLNLLEKGNETYYMAANGYAVLFSKLDTVIDIEVIDPTGLRTLYGINDSTSNIYATDDTLHLQNLTGGRYFVSALDTNGYKAYNEFEILPYEEFYIESTSITNAKRIDEASGSINVVVIGGAGDYNYTWESLSTPVNTFNTESFENTSLILNAKAGDYRFTVTDKYGNNISDTFTIEQPQSELQINIAEYRNESCKDYEDAYVVLSAEGGWGDYQYRPDSMTYFFNNNIWLDLEVREHYFYLTDKMGVEDSILINITEPDYLTAGINFVDSVNCKSASDGYIHFAILGGTQPYRFAFEEHPDFWTQDTIVYDLAEGIYSFIYTDSNNCIGKDTVQVYMPEPDSLLFQDINITHTTCDTDNGIITVSMQGGTRPYHYNWFDFNLDTIGYDSTITALAQSGYYFLNVYDLHNCPQHFEQLINPSTLPNITDIETTEVLCYGDSNGTAIVTNEVPANPFAPYDFIWSNSNTGRLAEGYPSGIHSVTIIDSNNCNTTTYFEVGSPDSLWVVMVNYRDAHCFGYNDGFIEVEPRGGVGGYSYVWTNGDTSIIADSLYTGGYSVLVIDSNSCHNIYTFAISQPDLVTVDLGEDITICPGNTITIDGQDFTTHKWYNSGGTISNERFVHLNEINTYYLEVTDSIGCYAWDTIQISIGDNALKADFLMTSEAALGDTLFIYELSNLELDSMRWEYNMDIFEDITDELAASYILHLQTKDTGIYNVKLWAYSGGCISNTTKQVEIIYEIDSTDGNNIFGYKDPLIISFTVSPNPNEGTFNANISLREEADIQLVVFSVDYGIKIDERTEYGLKDYELSYSLSNLTSGVYVIMLNAGTERRQVKIIII